MAGDATTSIRLFCREIIMRICKVDGCSNKYFSKGYCSRHYQQVKKYGKIYKQIYPEFCTVEGCNNKYLAKGYCNKHYTQLRRYGHVLKRTRITLNKFIIKDDICYIYLYSKQCQHIKTAIIDAEDYVKVKDYKWCIDGQYVSVRKNKKRIFLHRLIMDTPENKFTDHINHNTLDNCKCNLRICTNTENSRNQKIRKRNTSGYKGVSCDTSRNKWEVHIGVDSKSIFLGRFEDKIEAAKAYDKAAIKYHGEFAYLNFPVKERIII